MDVASLFSDAPKKSIAYGLVAALFGAAAGAWLERTYRPPEIKVETKTVEKVVKGDTVIQKVEGPVRIQTNTVVKYKEGPIQERLVTTVVEKAATYTGEHDVVTVQKESVATQLDKPLPDPPNWAVGTGVQILPGRELQFSLERRIAGPFWLTAWALQPIAMEPPKSLGVGGRLEF